MPFDDYNCFYQKLSTTIFPNEYKMLPPREILLPTVIDYDWPDDRTSGGYPDYKVDTSGDQVSVHYGTWQRRWVYPVEVISKDETYMYSKRVIINEPEYCVQPAADNYDQAGRLWRVWVRDHNLSQTGYGIMDDMVEVVDLINYHRTICSSTGEKK